MMIYIEILSIKTWLFYVLPYLIKQRLRRVHIFRIDYIDATKTGKFLVRITQWVIKTEVQQFLYRLVDVKDEAGDIIRLKVSYFDLAAVQQDIQLSPDFQKFFQEHAVDEPLKTYLLKQAVTGGSGNFSLWRTLFLIRLAEWKTHNENRAAAHSVLFLRKRLWMDQIRKYATQHNVLIKTVNTFSFQLKDLMLKFLGPIKLRFIRNVFFEVKNRGVVQFFFKKKYLLHFFDFFQNTSEGDLSNDRAHLALEYYGQLNLNQPAMHSDLFFWQQASFDSQDIIMTFSIPIDPLDSKKMNELNEHGIKAIILNSRASQISSVPLFQYWPRKRNLHNKIDKIPFTQEEKWLNDQLRDFAQERFYWEHLFRKHNIKVFVSWFKYSAQHCIIADALKQSGGVLAIYQRAYEEFSSPETTVAADIVFGFSTNGLEIERNSESNISYYIVTGYLGDHRFSLVREKSQVVRQQLQNNGAKHILAFFDENSGADSRWHTGHEFMQDNYAFLLEKVLENPWLGVILKPKQSADLRRRLGKVNGLLLAAEKTGRCFIFAGGAFQAAYPPAIAALAADIAIHGHLCAATAGIESALTGVPTILLDREGWSISKLYRFKEGRVVFKNWLDLWRSCEKYWKDSQSISGFGDWSSLINEIDPFHDGRAAERMGNYLGWLIDGFNSGLSREMVLADAAERYGKLWGRDKVFEISDKFVNAGV